MDTSNGSATNVAVKYLLPAGIALCAAIFILGGSKKAKGPNPFKSDTRVDRLPYQYDKAKRDEVIKCGYSAKKVEGQQYDVIVIGSGIGGLMSAALLARAGKKVLVLEQHDQAGGCCHSFHEKGYEFDTGIHYIGEMRNNTSVKFLFDQVSNGQLGWTNVRDDFDTVVIVDNGCQTTPEEVQRSIKEGKPIKTTQISFMSTQEETIANLVKEFPQNEAEIRKYFKTLASCRKSLLWFVSLKLMPTWMAAMIVHTGIIYWLTDYFNFSGTSVTKMIRKVTKNDRLRAVLAYNFGDYGTIPKEAPFSMHAALQNHFLKGVSYPTGGSSEISYTIIPTILKAGGAVLVRADVDSIETTTVRGVHTAVGVKMRRDGNIIRAPCIISAAGMYNTVQRLLPEPCRPSFNHMLRHVRPGTGGMSVYVGLNGTAEELGLNGKHYWAMWDDASNAFDLDSMIESYLEKDVDTVLKEKPNVPMLFISFPSAKDPLWDAKHPGKSTATIVTFASYDWFKKWEDKRVMHRGNDYDAIKKGLGDIIWQQTLSLFPQLKNKVEYFDVGTPVTNKYYLAATGGEMYGLDHNLARFTPTAAMDIRPETAVKNLYLTGQDVFTAGFVGAAFGGLLSASAVLNRNLYEDLTDLKKKSPPCRFD